MITKTLQVLCFLLITIVAQAQVKDLTEVQRNRNLAQDLADRLAFDSACTVYARFVANQKYTNPYDELQYSYCCLKNNDTVQCKRYLGKSIQSGIDSGTVYSFYRKLTPGEKDQTDRFLKNNFGSLHQTFLATHDTVLINELACFRQMDQMARAPIQKLIAKYRQHWDEDSNAQYLTIIQKLADSLNYIRIVRLFEQGRFPGYRLCGAATSDLVMVLFHLDGTYVNWSLVQTALKKAVIDGDLDPAQAASIIERHYLGLPNPVYYYGRLKWSGKYEFYDCKNVDKFRAEIGIESLRTEYLRVQRALPECYDRK